MKILILKPSSLGDVVQALPVLRLLKAHNPTHEIYWWLTADLHDLLDRDPDLAGLFLFERRRWGNPLHWGEMFKSLRQIRGIRFDCVIDLQGLARSGLLAWLADAKLSIGVEDWREGAPGFYDQVVRRPSALTHAVDWYLEVLKVLGVPRHWNFTWIPKRPEAAASVEAKWKPGGTRWIAINPGARWPNKRWPVEFYRESVRQLSVTYPDLRFVILGSHADFGLGNVISEAAPRRCLDLAGKTSLSELIEWLRLSSAVLSNDTGPMHIAAALGRPVIAMFGPTEPRRTGPYGQIDRTLRLSLPCIPCLKPTCAFEKPMECLRALRPTVVCSQLFELLNGCA